MARETTLRASSCLFASKGNDLTTVAAPTWTESSDWFEPMWDAVVDLVAILVLQQTIVSTLDL